MSELTLKEHYELDGGTFNVAAFFNGYVTELAGTYVPPQRAREGDAHFSHYMNREESKARRLAGTCEIYVYKDSGDTELQFSVKAGLIFHRGLLYVYAGGTGIGGLVAGASRYIWANLLPDKTVTIEVGAALPTAPNVIVLAHIAAPASGHWRPSQITRWVSRHAASAAGGAIWSVEVPITYQSVGVIPVATVRAGARIHRITTVVETAFNGTTPTIKYGDAGDDDRLVGTGFVNLGVVEKYIAQPFHKYAAETPVIATLAIGGAPSQGAATIIMEHS